MHAAPREAQRGNFSDRPSQVVRGQRSREAGGGRSPAPRAGFPAINVYAHQDGIVITAELPGVQQDDLEITVHRDTVTLRGERQDQPEDAGAYHRRERGRGSFVRTFGLPFQVDPDKVDAQLRDGVLTLALHRPEHDKPKRIRVSGA